MTKIKAEVDNDMNGQLELVVRNFYVALRRYDKKIGIAAGVDGRLPDNSILGIGEGIHADQRIDIAGNDTGKGRS